MSDKKRQRGYARKQHKGWVASTETCSACRMFVFLVRQVWPPLQHAKTNSMAVNHKSNPPCRSAITSVNQQYSNKWRNLVRKLLSFWIIYIISIVFMSKSHVAPGFSLSPLV